MIRAAAVLCLLSAPAAAVELPPGCAATRSEVVAGLGGFISEGGYEESQMSVMLNVEKGVMEEVYGNPRTGTWTRIVVRPDGVTCITAAGAGFQSFPYRPAGDPA
jgi:hypothetical protein